jgi:hypothetical protein
MVERLATGAGDLAAGMASFLRHVGGGGTGSQNTWEKATTEEEAERPAPKKIVKKRVVPKKVG